MHILSLHATLDHRFSKQSQPSLRLIEGEGIEGDAHRGVTVRHRSRVAADPTQPNLRQVHLVHAELFAELSGKGFAIFPGDIGENITTQGIDLLALPRGALLMLGAEAVIEVTGLRNPCAQLDAFRPGLMKAVLDRDAEGNLVRKAGIMGIVLRGGVIVPGDAIRIRMPPEPHQRLERV